MGEEAGQAVDLRKGDRGRTGLWLIGARGSIATTVACGLLSVQKGLAEAIGSVTERLKLPEEIFPGLGEIVIGGHDIVHRPIRVKARELARSGVLDERLLEPVDSGLAEFEEEIRPGYDPGTHRGPQRDAVRRLTADLDDFRRRHRLATVVVVNVASTEPTARQLPEHSDPDALDGALTDPRRAPLPPGALAACAAFHADCPFAEFTPAASVRLPAVAELAHSNGLPFAGSDGKTGQTLLRSVLAPMFESRALRVHSWSGTNLLGGGDGANLSKPENAEGKLASKARTLNTVLGKDVTAPLHIDNVPDLGDRKVAWDFVSFEGFLGARMSLQLTWDGVDSALAAPLVLDLARLLAGAQVTGQHGAIGALGYFFKDPLGSDELRLAEQYAALRAWVDGAGAR